MTVPTLERAIASCPRISKNQFDLAIPLVVENWGDKKRVSLRGHRFDSELCEKLA